MTGPDEHPDCSSNSNVVFVPPKRISLIDVLSPVPAYRTAVLSNFVSPVCTFTATSTDSLPLTTVSLEFSTFIRYSPAFNVLPFNVEGCDRVTR